MPKIERKLDRLESFDPRSKMFMVRRKVEGQEPIFKLWDCKTVLDQGSGGPVSVMDAPTD